MNQTMSSLLTSLRVTLRQASDEAAKKSGQRFFKEAVKLYGIKTAALGQIIKSFNHQVLALPKTQVIQLCEELWQSGYLEETFVACHFSHRLAKTFQPADFQIFERWINQYITNWASCDTFCNHTVGSFIIMYPEFMPKVIGWTSSANRWVKRAAAVSLIVPAHHGQFLPEVFAIADRLLTDPDDMVQKGYGWLLKVASQAHQQEVFEYVMAHKATMPRTALRYAIEKMPVELKKQAMAR